MMQFPLMVKSSDYEPACLIPLSILTIIYDDNEKYIDHFLDGQADPVRKLMSTSNHEVLICELRCQTYEELLVELELRGLLYGEVNNDTPKCDCDEDSSYRQKYLKLKRENTLLKSKLAALEKVINS